MSAQANPCYQPAWPSRHSYRPNAFAAYRVQYTRIGRIEQDSRSAVPKTDLKAVGIPWSAAIVLYTRATSRYHQRQGRW